MKTLEARLDNMEKVKDKNMESLEEKIEKVNLRRRTSELKKLLEDRLDDF